MKYLKLFEYYNENNFKEVVYENASKVPIKEYEYMLKRCSTFEAMMEYLDNEDFDDYFPMFGEVSRTYKKMFTHYLYRYDGPLSFENLKEYIIGFPLIYIENKIKYFDNKLKKIFRLFTNKFDIFRAILGDNNDFKYSKSLNDELIGDAFCNEIAFEKFDALIADEYVKITIPYLSKFIEEEPIRYKRVLDIEFTPFSNSLLKELNKALPKYITRSHSSGLLDTKIKGK